MKGKVLSILALLLMAATGAVAQTTYTVTVKDGTEDADKWTADPNPATAGQTVTYSGSKKVKSVKAVKKASAAAAMPTLTWGEMTQGGDPMSGGSGSGTYYAPTFSAGQQVAVIYKNTSGNTVKVLTDALTASDISNEGKSATINVTIDDADKSQPVTYIYPATMANEDGTVNYGSFNFTAQSGTEASITSSSLRDCCMASGAWDGNALPSVTMASQIAIWKLTLTHFDEIFVNKVTVKVGGNKVAEASKSGYFAYPIVVYLALNPATMGTGTLRIEADELGEIYYIEKSGGVSLTAGKFYQSTLYMDME